MKPQTDLIRACLFLGIQNFHGKEIQVYPNKQVRNILEYNLTFKTLKFVKMTEFIDQYLSNMKFQMLHGQLMRSSSATQIELNYIY